MNLEELLRDGMEQHSADIALPPGLFGKAERRYRMRRNGVRVLAMSGVVATGAAVGVAVAGTPAATVHRDAAPSRTVLPGPGQLETVGYLRGRITAAIDASDAIVHATNTFGNNPTEQRWTDQRTGRFVGEQRTVDGHRWAYSWPGHGVTDTFVDYTSKQWWTEAGGGFPMKPGKQELTVRQIRAALADGTMTIVGHERLRGHDTVHVRATSSSAKDGRLDAWVDATSYLPLRVDLRLADPVPSYARAVTDFDWLPRTPHNVGLTSLTVPAGFVHGRG